jgi:hypothetical protein
MPMQGVSSVSLAPNGELHVLSAVIQSDVRLRILLLDVYSVPLYVNQAPLEAYRAPVRYLRTHSEAAPVCTCPSMSMSLISSLIRPPFSSPFHHPTSYKRPAQLLLLSQRSQHHKRRQSCCSYLHHMSLFLGDTIPYHLHHPPLIRMVPSGRKTF